MFYVANVIELVVDCDSQFVSLERGDMRQRNAENMLTFFVDYESLSDVISSKHAELGELGKSLTLPRCHLFKVPQVPERKSSVDSKFEALFFSY